MYSSIFSLIETKIAILQFYVIKKESYHLLSMQPAFALYGLSNVCSILFCYPKLKTEFSHLDSVPHPPPFFTWLYVTLVFLLKKFLL